MGLEPRSDRGGGGRPIRLLVTGGRGFLGRHLVSHALALGWQVTSLSLRPAREPATPGVRELAADLADGPALGRVLGSETFDYVINCAGYIDHASFAGGGRKVFEAHFNGLLNLTRALDATALRGFVNLGSSDEYGGAPAPQRETQREQPVSPYALAKCAATHLLQALHRTEAFPAVTLRLFLTYGPGQDDRRFLPQVIRGCLTGQPFPVSGGEQLRDFCFVQDTVDAVFAALASPVARGEVINVASGEPVSVRRVIELVRELVGRGRPEYGAIAYRPGENLQLYADIQKAAELLGWAPQTTLRHGLQRTIQSISALP